MRDAVAVFVHGILSSSKTWNPLIRILGESEEIEKTYDLKSFEYDSPKWNFNPARRIPDFAVIARSLKTFLETTCIEYRVIVLIAHSQGGLIVQRYLAEMLADGQGRELARISRIILLACPNNGAEFTLVLRRAFGRFWLHPQERALRPYNDAVADAHRRVMNRVVHASSISSDSCPIVFRVYAGESDNIVTPASARSTFPDWGALRGDHNSILRADSVDHQTFVALKTNLLQVAKESYQAPRLSSEYPASVLSRGGSLEYVTPLLKIKKSDSRLGSTTSSETEIFDQSLADQYYQQHLSPEEGADN